MHLLHVLVVFCSLAFACSRSIELRSDGSGVNPNPDPNEVPATRPSILELISQKRIGRYVAMLHRFLNLLNDKEVSTKIYDLIDGRQQIWKDAKACGERNIVESLNDPSNIFGRLVGTIRMGEPALTDLKQLREINVLTIIPMLWFTLQNFRIEQALTDGQAIIDKLSDNCLNGDLKAYKDDVEFILMSFESKVLMKKP